MVASKTSIRKVNNPSNINKMVLWVRLCVIYVLTMVYSGAFCVWFAAFVARQPSWKFWKIKKRVYPECLRNPALGVHKYAQLNTIKLHYIQSGDSSKQLMLFVHGFPEFWYSWRHQMNTFSSDYWVVAMDLRGYGDSERPGSICDYHMGDILQDIRDLIISLGRHNAILVGHDWGGVLLWNFLDHYPDMVDQYIIINAPHTHSWITVTTRNLRQFFASWYCFFFQAPYLPELALSAYDLRIFDSVLEENCDGGAFTAEDLEAYKYIFSKEGALTAAINYYRANCGIISLKDKPPNRLPPGLFLFSDRDEYLVTDYLDLAKKCVRNVETQILENCRHFVPQTNPEAVNDAMRRFLGRNKRTKTFNYVNSYQYINCK